MRKLHPINFYILFFILNLINGYILLSGYFHPNLSSYPFTFSNIVSSLMGNIGVLLLTFCISIILFKKTRSRMNFLTTMSFLLMFLCVGLAVFTNIFTTFFRYIHLESFANPSQGTFVVFYFFYALAMLSDIAQYIHVIPFVILLIARLFIKRDQQHHFSPLLKLGVLFISFFLMVTPMVKLNNIKTNTIYDNSMDGIYGSNIIGVYNYYIYDIFYSTSDHNRELTEDQEKTVEEYLSFHQLDTYINPIDNTEYTIYNQYTNLADGKNLLIVQLEAFNQFLIGLEVDGVEITPNLNRLANSGVQFTNFYATAGIGNTSDSEFSASTGFYGTGNELTIFNYNKENYHTLSKDFINKGYKAFSLHGNHGDFYHRRTEHIRTLGFEKHYDLEYFYENNPDLPLIHGYLDDKYFFERTIDILEQENGNFYAYAVAVTSHSPYVPTEKIPQNKFEGLTDLASNYLDFVMYVDQGIGLLIEEMENRNLLDNTVLVIHGDHSSSLFLRDLQSIYNTNISEVDFRMTMQNVPFIVYNEDIFDSKLIDKVGGTNDIYRTMSNLFGLDSKYHFGFDLFTDEPGYVYSPRSLDLIFDDVVIFYPSKKLFGTPNYELDHYLEIFINHKYVNDLILRSNYFK